MNFADIKQIVQEIKKNIACRECEKSFSDNDIRIIGTVFNEGYFLTQCRKCKNKMIINVILKPIRQHRKISKKRAMKTITPDDVLDMCNFLKSFDGDFLTLFENK